MKAENIGKSAATGLTKILGDEEMELYLIIIFYSSVKLLSRDHSHIAEGWYPVERRSYFGPVFIFYKPPHCLKFFRVILEKSTRLFHDFGNKESKRNKGKSHYCYLSNKLNNASPTSIPNLLPLY